MTADYIKQEISEEICEDGGATARLVNNRVLPLGTAVDEAIRGNYVKGEKGLITAEVQGVIASMVANTAKDGNARQIDGLFTIYPQYVGLIDPEKGHDPAKNGVETRIRLLKELRIDTSKWTFNDVTPGRVPIRAYNASTGGTVGVVENGTQVKFVGYGLETATRVEWRIEGTEKSGVFPESVLGRSANVLTVPALDGLDQSCDGKTIRFDVYGAKNLSTVNARAKYVEPPPANPTLTKVHPSDEPENDGWMKPNPYENTVEGTNLAAATKLEFKYVDGEDEYVDEFEIVSKTADRIVFKANADTLQDIGGHLIVTTPAGTCEGDFMATVMGS